MTNKMLTCNDCIHQELCNTYAKFGVTDVSADDTTICDLFKNKALIIELPCKVGTPVFIVNKMGRICPGKFRLDDIDQFGKRVFLTRKEAEKAVKGA